MLAWKKEKPATEKEALIRFDQLLQVLAKLFDKLIKLGIFDSLERFRRPAQIGVNGFRYTRGNASNINIWMPFDTHNKQ